MARKGRVPGFSPVTGWEGTLVKDCKKWSMPQSDWDWLESQPNQSEILREAIAQYRNKGSVAPKKPRHDRREKLKQFLKENAGWHDAYAISEQIGSSPQNIQNLALELQRTFPLDIRKGIGKGKRNEYRFSEKDIGSREKA
jgi:hypothetical protein